MSQYLPLSDRRIAALPYAEDEGYIARDTQLPGFFVIVGKRTKSFAVQADMRVGVHRQTIRMKLGDAHELSTREARAKARALLGKIASGIDPREMMRGAEGADGSSPTLREAWTRYRESHLVRKGRADVTIAHYRDHIERLMRDWLNKPLMELGEDPRLVADRHEKITRENGPAMANGAMRSLRAVYNHARKTCRKLPAENPTFAVDWNPQKRRDTAMGVRDLPAWFAQLAVIENPIRREFHLLALLSGSRPDALKRVKLEDLHVKERRLHIGRPKGGEAKAFDIPLSRAMIRSIVRARRFAAVMYPEASKVWLFPSDAPSGHLEEHKEDRDKVLSHWGNDLRQTYRTLGQVAGVSDVDMHLLMNHSLPGVNTGYITRAKLMGDHLRAQQERVSTVVKEAILTRGAFRDAEVARWLGRPGRVQVAELLASHPDELRARFGPRSALRKRDAQAARCLANGWDQRLLEPPSRRRKRAA